MTIKIYVGQHCAPCHEIERLIKEGNFETDLEEDLEIIDVESESGFAEVAKEELYGIPVAKYKGNFCRLEVDEDTKVLIISCKKEDNSEKWDQDKDRESSDL